MEFLLDPDVVFLNHGSFGACPRVVHEEYQRLQRRLEAQPVRFLQRELPGLLADARGQLAAFLGAESDEVVFVSNPTYAVNEIARSLGLGIGDEVLTSNHEYGACRNAWQFVAERAGFSIVEVAIPLPVEPSTITTRVSAAITPRTRAIFLSHITSPTALTLPVADICASARDRGIVTVIDGAHAPGQIDLDLTELGADYYVGTCHKWMCAPKGSAFFYARRDVQDAIEPLVVGWGWGDDRQFDSGSTFLDIHEWLGTDDPSAFLAVPAAIRFQEEHDWPAVQGRCHRLAVNAVDLASAVPGVRRVQESHTFAQMGLVEIETSSGATIGPGALQSAIYATNRVEVPVISWTDPSDVQRIFVRVSVQAYNTEADIDALVEALTSVTSI